MIQINIGARVSAEPGWTATPRRHRFAMSRARERAVWIARNIRTAAPFFAGLRFGRTLSSLVADKSLRISFEDTDEYHGATEAVLESGLGRRSELRTLRDNRRTPYKPGISG